MAETKKAIILDDEYYKASVIEIEQVGFNETFGLVIYKSNSDGNSEKPFLSSILARKWKNNRWTFNSSIVVDNKDWDVYLRFVNQLERINFYNNFDSTSNVLFKIYSNQLNPNSPARNQVISIMQLETKKLKNKIEELKESILNELPF